MTDVAMSLTFYNSRFSINCSVLQLVERAAQLVGATGGFVSTADSIEPAFHLLDRHTPHQRANALQIAIASTYETDVHDAVVVIHLDVNQLAACALCLISDTAI